MFVLNAIFLLAFGKFGICVAAVPTYMFSSQYKPLTLESLIGFPVDHSSYVWSQFHATRLSMFLLTLAKGNLKANLIFSISYLYLSLCWFFFIFFCYNKSELNESTIVQCLLWGPWHTTGSLFNTVYLHMTGFHFSHAIQLAETLLDHSG